MAKHAASKSFKTSIAKTLIAAFLASFGFAGLSQTIGPIQPASAAVDFSGEYLNFPVSSMVTLNGNAQSPSVGTLMLYPSAGVIQGVAVDVTIEVIAISSPSPSSNNYTWDSDSDSQFNGVTLNQAQKDMIILNMNSNEVTYKFSFWESGSTAYVGGSLTGIPLEIRNLLVNTYDLDNDQWAAFSGFQSYELSATPATGLAVSSISGNLVKFLGPSSNYSNNASFNEGRVRVNYAQASTMDIRINAPSGALYALQFGAGVAWTNTPQTITNSFNKAPTSSDTVKYLVPSSSTALTIADFGNYSDPESNPLAAVELIADFPTEFSNLQYFDGTSTVSPLSGSTVSADAIAAGNLSYLMPDGTTGPATVSFRVGDGVTFSAQTYSITLLPSINPQSINFPDPSGIVDPNGGPFSSSATATSGLPVVLTSNTPTACRIVNGTDIEPLITTVKTVCSVTATQPGNSTWASAQPVTRIFYFTNQEIVFPQPSNQIYSSGLAISSSAVASSSGLAVTLTAVNSDGICSVSGLDINILATGSCVVRAEQTGGSTGGVTYLAATPVVRTFEITSGPTYTVTYDANSGTGTLPSNATGVTTHSVGTGSLVKSGFNFAGWNEAADAGGTDHATNSNITLTSNLTLYAKWRATIVFDSQGGAAVSSVTYIYGQPAITLPTAVKSGYTFNGWATTVGGTALPSSYSSGSATLYAIWAAPTSGGSPGPYTSGGIGSSGDMNPVVIQPTTYLADSQCIQVELTASCSAEIEIPGEGHWAIDPSTGKITFQPVVGFQGTSRAYHRVISNNYGYHVAPLVAIITAPTKILTFSRSIVTSPSKPAMTDPSWNGVGDACLIDALENTCKLEVNVRGVGIFTYDPVTRTTKFRPDPNFLGTFVIQLKITQPNGSVTYVPISVTVVSDELLKSGTPGTNPTSSTSLQISNKGLFDNEIEKPVGSSVCLVDPESGECRQRLVIPGESVWNLASKQGLYSRALSGFIGISYATLRYSWSTGATLEVEVSLEVRRGPVSREIGGFLPGSPVITSAIRSQIAQFLAEYPDYSHLTCVGVTMGPTVLKVDYKLSMDRAINGCAVALGLKNTLIKKSVSNRQELNTGSQIRRVVLTLSDE